MTTATRSNNRALTLAGANKLFEAIGVQIEQSDLGFYWTTMKGKRYERKTLTELGQALLIALNAAAK
ncbi:MAG TPA: hypothetical protein V6D29_03575 [Leptolyngbyaceae cyanobacterium]